MYDLYFILSFIADSIKAVNLTGKNLFFSLDRFIETGCIKDYTCLQQYSEICFLCFKIKYLTNYDVVIKSQAQKYHIIMEDIPLQRLKILRTRYSFNRFFSRIQVQYKA